MTKTTVTQTMDSLLAEMDPEVLLAGILGGIAASGGIIPPFTRLMVAFGGSSDDFNALVLGAGTIPFVNVIDALKGKEKIDPKVYALAASGAFEAMAMMALVKNEALMSEIFKAVGSAVGSIGSLAGSVALKK